MGNDGTDPRESGSEDGTTVPVPPSFAEDFRRATEYFSAEDQEEARRIARHCIRRGEGQAVYECFAILAGDMEKGLLK